MCSRCYVASGLHRADCVWYGHALDATLRTLLNLANEVGPAAAEYGSLLRGAESLRLAGANDPWAA